MATRFEMILHGDRPEALRAAAEEALDEIESVERQLSVYRPDSDLSVLNREAGRGWVRVDNRLFRLLERVRDLHASTGGAFDPSIAPVLFAWGLMGGGGRVPSAEEQAEAFGQVGFQFVSLDRSEGRVRYERPGLWLDLGSIGKGYALERAVELLREAGVGSGLIHGGTSTVCAIGCQPGGAPWRVAIGGGWRTIASAGGSTSGELLSGAGATRRMDGDVGSGLEGLPVVELVDESLSVSEVRGKAFEHDGLIYGHVIDPRLGRPVSGARSAAVIAASATDSDALSTALLVLGEAGRLRVESAGPGVRCFV